MSDIAPTNKQKKDLWKDYMNKCLKLSLEIGRIQGKSEAYDLRTEERGELISLENKLEILKKLIGII